MKLEVVNMKHELGEMGESIEDDKKMLAELMLASELSMFFLHARGVRLERLGVLGFRISLYTYT